jgi:hypothetical protein
MNSSSFGWHRSSITTSRTRGLHCKFAHSTYLPRRIQDVTYPSANNNNVYAVGHYVVMVTIRQESRIRHYQTLRTLFDAHKSLLDCLIYPGLWLTPGREVRVVLSTIPLALAAHSLLVVFLDAAPRTSVDRRLVYISDIANPVPYEDMLLHTTRKLCAGNDMRVNGQLSTPLIDPQTSAQGWNI